MGHIISKGKSFMKVLIVGSGGREHALAWKLAQSASTPTIYCAPGNAGTASLGTNVAIGVLDIDALLAFVEDEGVDLTVVGPEAPLVAGIVDRFEAAGHPIMGPSAAAAQLEGSKAFAKAFMARNNIPTAAYRQFMREDYTEAVAFLEAEGAPIVVKASGLAAGKGAVVCMTLEKARAAVDEMLQQGRFGEASEEVVIEAFMEGEEASVFALCDGENYIVLAPAQDHKRVGEGDTGPNTGGMGAYAPAPIMTEALLETVCETIIEPTLLGMKAEGHPYKGVLYAGLMMTNEGPKVVEFNCRFGDPETQVVLPLLDGDLVDIFQKLTQGKLDEVDAQTHTGASACVVLASKGYPGSYTKGFTITGLDEPMSATVFHAGTKTSSDGTVVTSGGRVLGISAQGTDLADALDKAYEAIAVVDFDGKQYRRDIGQKGLQRLAGEA